nr:MFS transporter [Streptococcus anginosus]
GLLVALIAPAVGQWADRSGKKNSLLTLTTLVTIVCMALLFLVAPSPSYLWLGVVLLAVGNIVFEIGSVVYNAMVTDSSTPATLGRISGFGWGMG